MRHLIFAGLKAASASVVLAVCGFVSTKILAVVLGPTGIGAYSLLRQLLMTATVVASLNPQAALAHAVARGERTGALDLHLSTAFWTVLGATGLAVGAGLALSGAAAGRLLPGWPGQGNLVALMAIPLVANVLSVVLLHTLQGLRLIGAAGIASIAGAAATAACSYPLALRAAQGEVASLVGLLLVGPLVSLAVAAFFGWRAGWLAAAMSSFRRLEVDRDGLGGFLRISLAGLAAALVAAASLLAVRSIVANDAGLEAAGVFDAAWTISHGCFGLMLAAFGSFYLPTLISVRDAREAHRAVNQALFLVTLVGAPAVVAGIAFRRELVALLYSPQFHAADGALLWMLAGQYLRFAGWTLSFLALARARMRVIVISETLWCLGLIAAALAGPRGEAPLVALGIAYAALYAAYFAFFAGSARWMEGLRLERGVMRTWFIGLAIVAGSVVLALAE